MEILFGGFWLKIGTAREMMNMIERPNNYENCTKEELENLLQQAQRLEQEGIPMTETIIKVEKVLEPKIDSGIIYEVEE